LYNRLIIIIFLNHISIIFYSIKVMNVISFSNQDKLEANKLKFGGKFLRSFIEDSTNLDNKVGDR